MVHVSGLVIIDAPASALNNSGAEPGASTDNTVAVKYIRTKSNETYPYVSAQAVRYWLRMSMERNGIAPGESAPIFREQKVAYTDANPMRYWDDDLLGYMRAPSKRTSAKEARASDETRGGETPTEEAITRASPFRVSTLVSIGSTLITNDFGVMARQDGDPVPFEHQFYRATLKGLFSLDLASAGTFTYMNRSGFKNLDAVRIREAEERELRKLDGEKAFQLPRVERARRIGALLNGLARLEGGAKQAIHYTDVAPSLIIAAVTKSGNNPFVHVVAADRTGQPLVRVEPLIEALTALEDEILSPIYFGWAPGYLFEQREAVTAALNQANTSHVVGHPRVAMGQLAADFDREVGQSWL